MKGILLGCVVVVVAAVLVIGLAVAGSYNRLVTLDENVKSKWGQVENVYQRRADLIPNLVETVKGARGFEKDTFTAVTEARAKVGQVNFNNVPNQQRDAEVPGGAGRPLVGAVAPDGRGREVPRPQGDRRTSTTCRSQLEGTENRIAVERKRFNEAAQEFNTARRRFPTVLHRLASSASPRSRTSRRRRAPTRRRR